MSEPTVPYHRAARSALVARLGPHGRGGAVQWTLWVRDGQGAVLAEVPLRPFGEVADAALPSEVSAVLRAAGYRARRRAAPRAYWGAWTLEPAPIDVEPSESGGRPL